MAIWSEIVYYVGRLVLFAAVAAMGIALGIRFRKKKNKKEALAFCCLYAASCMTKYRFP